MSGLKDIAKKLAAILASALQGGSSQSDDHDPVGYFKMMEDHAEKVHGSYGDGEQFEKSISWALKAGIGIAAGAPGLTVADKLMAAGPEMSAQLPQLLEKSGLNNLIKDYMIKDPKFLDDKINNVVSQFTDQNMALGGAAAGFASEIGKYLSESVPKTPLQNSGLVPDIQEISQSLDRHQAPKQEYKNDLRNGPSPSR